MTLRTKLSLSVGCAIALSIALTLFLTWQRVSDYVLFMEEKHFASLAETMEHNLQSSYREYLSSKVRTVLSTKQQMRSMTLDARNDLQVLEQHLPPSEQRRQLGMALMSNHDGERASQTTENFSILLTTVGDLRLLGIPAMGIDAQMRNVKQQTCADIVLNLPKDGEFALWSNSKHKDEPILLFFLPVDADATGVSHAPLGMDRVLVSGLLLTSLFQEADSLLRHRIDTAKQNFEHIPFYGKGLLMIRDTKGEALVQRGDAHSFEENLGPLYAVARSQDHAKGRIETEQGEYLCHIAWIDAYNWYLVMAAPLNVLRTPSSQLISRLLMLGLVIVLASTLFTIFMVMRAMRPLHQLRDWTNELAAVDPSSTSSLDALENMLSQRLNLKRRDELGDLARSFASMGRELVSNIRSSMAAMTVQKRIEGELNAAKDIQMGILPDLNAAPPEPGFSVAAFLEPAREVGGDLYDCFTLDDGRKAIVLGDVSGKGVPAALFMTMSLTLTRYALRSGLDPAQAMTQVNTLLEEHNPGNMFVTLFLAVYDPATKELLYANGGHCLPFIVDARGHLRQLENLSGPLVGAMPCIDYLLFKDILADGESCFLYTDGLTEAMNADKELYGEKRLAACLAAHADVDPHSLHKAVFADICAFRGHEPPSDDIAMLTACRPGTRNGDAA